MVRSAFRASSAPSMRFGFFVSSDLQPADHAFGEAFERLQHDVADKSVADDHIHAIVEQIMAFDIADEIEIDLLAELERLLGQFVAFVVFGAVAQNSRPAARLQPRISRE